MVDGTQVRADGVETEGGAKRSKSALLPVLLISVLVSGFFVISLAVPDSQPVTSTQPGEAVAQPEDLRAQERGIGQVIAGFEDAVVGVSMDSDGNVVHLLWPNTRPLVERETPGEGDVSFDASGVFMASLSATSTEGRHNLLAGRFNSLRLVSEKATSFAWHDDEPGRLGYVVDLNDHWEVWGVIPGFPASVQFEGTGPIPQLVAWGEWGFAMQDDDEVALLTPEGGRKASHQGRVLASRGDGWLLVSGDSIDLLSAGGGVVRTQVGTNRVGSVLSASFSSDMQSIALVGSRGILVSPIRGEGETKELHVEDASRAIWSTDSRFLIVPRSVGLSIFDLRSVNQFFVLEDHVVSSVGIISLADS